MKKKEYFKKLNRALWLHISKEERKEILLDYEEYFSEGATRGESEEQISMRLGQPQSAAKALIAERGSLLFSKHRFFMLVSMVLPFLALWSMSWEFWIYIGDLTFWISPYVIFLLGIIGFVLRARPWKQKIRPVDHVYPIVVACVSVEILIAITIFLIWFSLVLLPATHPTEQQVNLLLGITLWMKWIFTCCVMVLWVWLLCSRKNDTPIRQTLNIWLSGLFGFLSYGYYTLRSLDDPETLSTFTFWANWLWPLVVGVVLTGIMILILHKVAKRSNEY